MKRVEALKIVKVLEAAYPRAEFTEERAEVYARFLEPLDYQAANRAVVSLIATSRFLPTIAEIRERVARLTGGIPEPEDALEEVRLAAQSGRYQFSHPAIRKAVDALGWEYIQRREDPGVWRSQFLRLYGPIRDRAMESHQTAGLLGSGGQAPALTDGRSA